MVRTGTQVVTRALRVAKVIGFDQTPSSQTLSEGFLVLQTMIDEWQADPQLHDIDNSTTAGIDDGVGNWTLPTFSTIAASVTIPDGLTVAIEGFLAERLSWEHGSEINPRAVQVASAALKVWRGKVAASQVPSLKGDVLYVVNGDRYNIFTDSSE